MALETELNYFESVKANLLDHHEGKYALIIGEKVLGTFDTCERAYKAGVEKRGNVPMFIKHVLRNEPMKTISSAASGLVRGIL